MGHEGQLGSGLPGILADLRALAVFRKKDPFLTMAGFL